jgi:PhoH-like ATPase
MGVFMYNGIKEVVLTDEELADFYSNKLKIDALQNQYVLIKDSQDIVVDKYRCDNSKLVKIKYRAIESQVLGKIKPRNVRQELLFDALDSPMPVICVTGPAGTGKSFISTAYALRELQNGKFNKFVVIKNHVSVQDIPELGALPGDVTEKLKSSCAFVADIISDFMFDSMLQGNKIEIGYLGNMRGRSLNECVVLVSEAQNLTTNLVKMIVSRIGENTKLIMDFDLEQIDKNAYSKDNGMMAMVESLKGNKLVGVIELLDVERSEVAKLASLIK